MLTALNLVVLKVSDIDASARFYTALGLSFVREQHGKGPAHLSCLLGSVLLEIYPAGNGPTSNATRLGFEVTSLSATLTALLAGGGNVISEPKASSWGLRAVVTDPDGHNVELLEAVAQPQHGVRADG
jgi:catechol 2,3-dioxygenase-like lactoylglutathione lyase family enzyme